nr:LysM peptidoglycan-binding domain-containing protein [Sedimentibacter sp.]
MLKYISQPYDTLYSIAQKFKFTPAQILTANPQINDNEQIYLGQVINIPGFMYEVRPNDTLNKIARQFNIPANLLISTNPQIMYCKNIIVGQKIFITSTQPSNSIAKEAAEIDSNARDILDDINNKNWDDAETKFSIIKNNFNKLKPMLQTKSVPQSLINIINDAIMNLENELAAKNVHESKVYAYIITEYMPDILDYLNTEMPADLNNLDYLGRELISNVERNDWSSASTNLEAIDTIWNSFNLTLSSEHKSEITNLNSTLNSLKISIQNKDSAKTIQEANNMINEIDTIKNYFEPQKAKSST